MCGTRNAVTFSHKYPAAAKKRYPVALILGRSKKRYAVQGFFKTLPRQGYEKRYDVMGRCGKNVTASRVFAGVA